MRPKWLTLAVAMTVVLAACSSGSGASPSAAGSPAKAFVEAMTTKDQQLAFATGFGVIPSIQSAEADYLAANPANALFVDGVKYARGVVTAPGIADVLADFDAQLDALATSDPKTILESVQQNLTDAIGS